jgi:hypothetical protein
VRDEKSCFIEVEREISWLWWFQWKTRRSVDRASLIIERSTLKFYRQMSIGLRDLKSRFRYFVASPIAAAARGTCGVGIVSSDNDGQKLVANVLVLRSTSSGLVDTSSGRSLVFRCEREVSSGSGRERKLCPLITFCRSSPDSCKRR